MAETRTAQAPSRMSNVEFGAVRFRSAVKCNFDIHILNVLHIGNPPTDYGDCASSIHRIAVISTSTSNTNVQLGSSTLKVGYIR